MNNKTNYGNELHTREMSLDEIGASFASAARELTPDVRTTFGKLMILLTEAVGTLEGHR